MVFLSKKALVVVVASSMLLFAPVSQALPAPIPNPIGSSTLTSLAAGHDNAAATVSHNQVAATSSTTEFSNVLHHHQHPHHGHSHNHLHKRHDYTLMCFSPSDRTDPKSPKIDDVPLARRCTGRPYRYSCDANANPDILDGGKTDKECDRYCECRNRSANPKPYCVGILGWNSYSTCF
jgi:hypothetical protein